MRTIHNYRNLITPVINRILSRTIKCSKAHNLNASASVEGAIVIPLFIYAVMSIMFIMQVIAVRIHINNAFYVTLRKCAGYVYVYENSGNVPKGMVAETIRRLLIDEIGTDYAADHNIMGGNAGIMFMSSTGMYITIQTVLLSMFLIIIAGGTLIAGGRMKLRTSMPYIPFLLVSLVCCVIGGGTILRTLLQ